MFKINKDAMNDIDHKVTLFNQNAKIHLISAALIIL